VARFATNLILHKATVVWMIIKEQLCVTPASGTKTYAPSVYAIIQKSALNALIRMAG
jgi:hypothetical protein